MVSYHAPAEWEEWIDWLAAGLYGRSRWRLPLLMMGLFFTGGRRVVASWIRTAGLSDDYQDYFFFVQSVGRRWWEMGRRVLVLALQRAIGKANDKAGIHPKTAQELARHSKTHADDGSLDSPAA